MPTRFGSDKEWPLFSLWADGLGVYLFHWFFFMLLVLPNSASWTVLERQTRGTRRFSFNLTNAHVYLWKIPHGCRMVKNAFHRFQARDYPLKPRRMTPRTCTRATCTVKQQDTLCSCIVLGCEKFKSCYANVVCRDLWRG